MKNLIKLTLLSVVLFNAYPTAWAASLYERLERPLLSLERKLAEKNVEALLKGTARIEAFQLQALGRLLENEAEIFEELKKDFKKMEDAIGQTQKWSDLISKGVAANRTKYKENFAREKAKLSEMASQWNRKKKIPGYLEELKEHDLKARKADPLLLSRLGDELRGILEKEYDFSEGETGMHELRRNLRWPAMEMDALQDLMGLKSQGSCPFSDVKELAKLAIGTKYAVLKVRNA